MEQRDYILKEIEKISIVILALLGKLKGMTSRKQFDQERELIDKDLQDNSGLTIDIILRKGNEELEKLLQPSTGFTFDNIELLANLLVEFTEFMDAEERELALNKAIFLLSWIERDSRTFSMTRQLKITEIENMLGDKRD